jgi:hypothetical protein
MADSPILESKIQSSQHMPQPQNAQVQVQSALEQQHSNGAIRSKGILRHRHICMNVVAETPVDCSDSKVEGTELADHHTTSSGTLAAAETATTLSKIFIVNPFSYQLEEKEFIDQRSRIIAWEKEYCDPSTSDAGIRYSRVSLKDEANVSITADNASGKQKMPFRTAWEKGIRNRMRDACVSAHGIAKTSIWDSIVEHLGYVL